MNINLLLERLKELEIYVQEKREYPDGIRAFIFRAKLPKFPFGDQETWYTLILESGQDVVQREEIAALLRHFWHGSTLFFGDEINEVGHPVDLIKQEEPPKEDPPSKPN
jgi:hypothetical protein